MSIIEDKVKEGEEWYRILEAIDAISSIFLRRPSVYPYSLDRALKKCRDLSDTEFNEVCVASDAYLEDSDYINDVLDFYKIENNILRSTIINLFNSLQNIAEEKIIGIAFDFQSENHIQEKGVVAKDILTNSFQKAKDSYVNKVKKEKSEVGRMKAKARWEYSPEARAKRKAYELWCLESKTGYYKSKLARKIIKDEEVSGFLISEKHLTDLFRAWEKGEKLPVC